MSNNETLITKNFLNDCFQNTSEKPLTNLYFLEYRCVNQTNNLNIDAKIIINWVYNSKISSIILFENDVEILNIVDNFENETLTHTITGQSTIASKSYHITINDIQDNTYSTNKFKLEWGNFNSSGGSSFDPTQPLHLYSTLEVDGITTLNKPVYIIDSLQVDGDTTLEGVYTSDIHIGTIYTISNGNWLIRADGTTSGLVVPFDNTVPLHLLSTLEVDGITTLNNDLIVDNIKPTNNFSIVLQNVDDDFKINTIGSTIDNIKILNCFYNYPNLWVTDNEWSQTISILTNPLSTRKVLTILNANNGNDAIPNSDWIAGMNLFDTNNLDYGWYVFSQYGNRDIDLVKTDILNIKTNWRSTKLFIDEVATGLDKQEYYTDLVSYSKSIGFTQIFLNTGTISPDYMYDLYTDDSVIVIGYENTLLEIDNVPVTSKTNINDKNCVIVNQYTNEANTVNDFINTYKDIRKSNWFYIVNTENYNNMSFCLEELVKSNIESNINLFSIKNKVITNDIWYINPDGTNNLIGGGSTFDPTQPLHLQNTLEVDLKTTLNDDLNTQLINNEIGMTIQPQSIYINGTTEAKYNNKIYKIVEGKNGLLGQGSLSNIGRFEKSSQKIYSYSNTSTTNTITTQNMDIAELNANWILINWMTKTVNKDGEFRADGNTYKNYYTTLGTNNYLVLLAQQDTGINLRPIIYQTSTNPSISTPSFTYMGDPWNYLSSYSYIEDDDNNRIINVDISTDNKLVYQEGQYSYYVVLFRGLSYSNSKWYIGSCNSNPLTWDYGDSLTLTSNIGISESNAIIPNINKMLEYTDGNAIDKYYSNIQNLNTTNLFVKNEIKSDGWYINSNGTNNLVSSNTVLDKFYIYPTINYNESNSGSMSNYKTLFQVAIEEIGFYNYNLSFSAYFDFGMSGPVNLKILDNNKTYLSQVLNLTGTSKSFTYTGSILNETENNNLRVTVENVSTNTCIYNSTFIMDNSLNIDDLRNDNNMFIVKNFKSNGNSYLGNLSIPYNQYGILEVDNERLYCRSKDDGLFYMYIQGELTIEGELNMEDNININPSKRINFNTSNGNVSMGSGYYNNNYLAINGSTNEGIFFGPDQQSLWAQNNSGVIDKLNIQGWMSMNSGIHIGNIPITKTNNQCIILGNTNNQGRATAYTMLVGHNAFSAFDNQTGCFYDLNLINYSEEANNIFETNYHKLYMTNTDGKMVRGNNSGNYSAYSTTDKSKDDIIEEITTKGQNDLYYTCFNTNTITNQIECYNLYKTDSNVYTYFNTIDIDNPNNYLNKYFRPSLPITLESDLEVEGMFYDKINKIITTDDNVVIEQATTLLESKQINTKIYIIQKNNDDTFIWDFIKEEDSIIHNKSQPFNPLYNYLANSKLKVENIGANNVSITNTDPTSYLFINDLSFSKNSAYTDIAAMNTSLRLNNNVSTSLYLEGLVVVNEELDVGDFRVNAGKTKLKNKQFMRMYLDPLANKINIETNQISSDTSFNVNTNYGGNINLGNSTTNTTINGNLLLNSLVAGSGSSIGLDSTTKKLVLLNTENTDYSINTNDDFVIDKNVKINNNLKIIGDLQLRGKLLDLDNTYIIIDKELEDISKSIKKIIKNNEIKTVYLYLSIVDVLYEYRYIKVNNNIFTYETEINVNNNIENTPITNYYVDYIINNRNKYIKDTIEISSDIVNSEIKTKIFNVEILDGLNEAFTFRHKFNLSFTIENPNNDRIRVYNHNIKSLNNNDYKESETLDLILNYNNTYSYENLTMFMMYSENHDFIVKDFTITLIDTDDENVELGGVELGGAGIGLGSIKGIGI